MKRAEAEEFTQSLEGVLSGGWRLTLTAVRLGVPMGQGASRCKSIS
jgi:hypothetical protein